MSLVTRAFEFSKKRHEGQKYGDSTYFDGHVFKVFMILSDLKLENPENTLAASFLHDTLEDTETTLDELHREFGEEVAQIVDLVTTSTDRWRSRRQKLLSWTMKFSSARSIRLPGHLQAARFVKLADRLANVKSCWEAKDRRLFMYRDEHATFEQTLLKWANPDPKLESLSLQVCELLDVPPFSMSGWLSGRPW